MLKRLPLLILIFLLNSCLFTNLTIKGKGDLKLKQVGFENLPNWQKDQQKKAVNSFVNSCNQFAKMSANKDVGGAIGNVLVSDFEDVCVIAKVIRKMGDAQARNFFENWFVPFEVSNQRGDSQGLFTGYYVPELRGSRTKTDICKYPVYAKPKNPSDLNLTREEIENGALANRNLELLYVDSPVDLFFMQVQGSGSVVMDDGSIVKLRYAAKNNYPYSSIGRHIIDNKILSGENATYFGIKDWLKNNPDEAKQAMCVNQSYVFFQVSNSDDVYGSTGAPLTAERSLAVDNEVMPSGVPVWLDIKVPNSIPYQKMVVTQDTGSATKGEVRGEVFFGRGKTAEKLAAKMNYKGKYYVLLPTAAVDRMVGR